MTHEEFYAKYGNVAVRFECYYKYTFTYSATLEDGSVLACSFGGNSDDIYRHYVASDGFETVGGLYPYAGVVTKDGTVIDEFRDY